MLRREILKLFHGGYIVDNLLIETREGCYLSLPKNFISQVGKKYFSDTQKTLEHFNSGGVIK